MMKKEEEEDWMWDYIPHASQYTPHTHKNSLEKEKCNYGDEEDEEEDWMWNYTTFLTKHPQS